MNWLLAALAVLCVFTPSAHCASDTIEWCYHLPICNYTTWPTIASQFCNGSRQSPINIVSASAEPDDSLTSFTFTNFDSTTALDKIENTGKTVKVTLNSGVNVSGGGLPENYQSLQFHLHWGDLTSPGSEHTVDGKQYPMELHIVNLGESHGGNTTLGLADSDGLAALGYLIEERTDNVTDQPESWRMLTSYLSSIETAGSSASISSGISLNDLLVGVNTSSYYRYLGSLTTPTCNEAVVWTVFKDPIKVSKNLINKFSEIVRIGNSTSLLMHNVYRGVQPSLPVSTQRSSTGSSDSDGSSGSSGTSTSASKTIPLGLLALSLALGRN